MAHAETPIDWYPGPVIDAHCHLFPDLTFVGADPERYLADAPVDALVDAGTFGPDTFAGFAAAVARRGRERPAIRCLLNVARRGFVEIPEIRRPDDFAPEDAAALAAESALGVGLKVRITRASWDVVGSALIERTTAAARAANIPVVVHVGEQSPDRPKEIPPEVFVPFLRAGDVVTHLYSAKPGAVFGSARSIDAAGEARDRGVLFDLGHGAHNFDIRVARRAIRLGFAPDLITSDVTAQTLGSLDLGRSIETAVAAGMPVRDAVAAATANAVAWLGDSIPKDSGSRIGIEHRRRMRRDSQGMLFTTPVRVHIEAGAR
ncbi:hypothetical protein [Microbacterium sp. CPCC 204701]|uniref:hypothetical protein n=1 Tax=Microbacterium sp. CPCC 204701 TaxID=2493084 RepID=UPI000FD9C3D9|nr:hypothetical protein [Microbacterium sp. CPCC 204701]